MFPRNTHVRVTYTHPHTHTGLPALHSASNISSDIVSYVIYTHLALLSHLNQETLTLGQSLQISRIFYKISRIFYKYPEYSTKYPEYSTNIPNKTLNVGSSTDRSDSKQGYSGLKLSVAHWERTHIVTRYVLRCY